MNFSQIEQVIQQVIQETVIKANSKTRIGGIIPKYS
jgi:hypothetical protein